MNDMIRQMLEGYFAAFDMYQIKSPGLQAQVDEFKGKLTAFGENNGDIMTFHTKLAESGLQEEYTNLISKVAMASMAPEEDQAPAASPEEVKVPTVEEFLMQYRTAYDEVCKAGYRKNGEAAYEALFAVAGRADDMLDAQIIMEKERLLWNIVKDDALDTYVPVLEAMDPLQTAVSITMEKQIEIYRKADSEEQLTRWLEEAEPEKLAEVTKFTSMMNVAAVMASILIKYTTAKAQALEWASDTTAQGGIAAMCSLRAAARKTLRFLEEDMGYTFDQLLENQGVAIWMLAPQNADALGRIKTALHLQNLEAFREIVNEEIKPDISIADILKRKCQYMFWPDLKMASKNRYSDRAEKRADQLNSQLTYYKFSLGK